MRATFTHLIGPKKGERPTFDLERITIGRAPDNDLCFDDNQRRVSSHHAEVFRRGDHYILRDLGSTNGTMINGRRVIASELANYDLVEFGAGGPLLRFSVEPEGALRDEVAERSDTADLSSSETATARLAAAPAARTNALLIVAILVAMAIGAVAGILLSRSIARDEGEIRYAEIAAQTAPAIAFISAEYQVLDAAGNVSSTETRTGSGFFIGTSGLLVTNRHLIRDWEYNPLPSGFTARPIRIDVMLPGRAGDESLQAEVHKLSGATTTDIAILRVDPAPGIVVKLAESDADINQGDAVAVMGYPLGMDLLSWTNDTVVEPTLSPGIVSRVGRDYIQLSLRAYRGNSGGPVLNARGEVIAVLTGKLSEGDIALCTPTGRVLALLR